MLQSRCLWKVNVLSYEKLNEFVERQYWGNLTESHRTGETLNEFILFSLEKRD